MEHIGNVKVLFIAGVWPSREIRLPTATPSFGWALSLSEP
jgi:hypothetical protein